MNLMTLENISKNYSEKPLLNNISLGINSGEKIGLIGVNGTGKSTLLKIIVGDEVSDSGTIIKTNGLRIKYLPQNPDYDENSNVLEQVFNSSSKELQLIGEYNDLLEKSNKITIEKQDELNKKILYVQENIDSLNLWDLESEAKSILTKLGINDFSQKIGALSGGQKKRVFLASALITPCDLLVLDEPTNHLDNDTIDWLEEYLNSRKGSLLMITHDRYFLDAVTNRIIELDKGILFSYDGNYSTFLERKSERLAMEASMEDKRQNLIRTELKWVKRGALARSTKQKARLQRFDELVNNNPINHDEKIDISVSSSRLGKKIIEIKNVTKSFGDKKVIDNFEYAVARNDRIGVIGKNGLGKSTLINLINKTIEPDFGTIDIGETVKIGYFSQDDSHMDSDQRAIDYVKEASDYIETADGTKITASQMCEKFLFNSTMQYTEINRLSGGERRRLHLLRVLMSAPNVLLLDEPTNDLDIATLNILEDYLDGFDGVIITVSHDRYFLNRVCKKIFAYEGNGKIYIYTGNYTDYTIYREIQNIKFEEENKLKSSSEKNTEKQKTEKPKEKKKVKLSYNEQREYENIDQDIENLENKIEALENSTSKFATDFTKLQEILDEKSELESELEHKYERWEYLNNLVEEINERK
ncbi:ABC-F family ATP-binding cassette domain-containing protein [Clostridioides mangenotii]|uniref:ABC-F family ATP-binding cassette domain-containing protein n=1 Tax=Metaclostridioides mangenotii TaxID=1540 RepID=UPI00214A72FF|nr:ABC-F family ATP-binding cassette domain-containing protein [Clostridioides mangenotii]MCR1953476.1 ABC-F family ATP-binding cassette domain-containing protein [Clostridioides mangenotii]